MDHPVSNATNNTVLRYWPVETNQKQSQANRELKTLPLAKTTTIIWPTATLEQHSGNVL